MSLAGFAAAPALEHFHPIAAQAGTTNLVTAIGKFDSWPPEVWADSPGLTFQPEKEKGRFMVAVAPQAAPGPRLVRLFNEQGASRPRFFLITREPQTPEKEPNDDSVAPQEIGDLPVALTGRLDKTGDADSFGVTLTAGQTLIVSVEAYVLASPLDALIRVVDDRGIQLAWNHDNGRTLDPFLAWTAPSPGHYVVQVMGFPYPATADVRLHGGDACVYRLHLSTGPFLHHTLPLGAQRGRTTPLHLVGWNLPTNAPGEIQFDGTALGTNDLNAALHVPGIDHSIRLPVSDGGELLETEPNDASVQANRMDAPGAVTGCIQSPGDQDRYAFTVAREDKLRWAIQSASLGFPLDAWLAIEDLTGKELARNEDSGGADPKLEWSAPTNGTFVAAVGHLLHRGGSNLYYRLEATRLVPDFKAVVADHTFALKPGATNDLKVTVTRLNGFDGKLTVQATGLPSGVCTASVEVPEKGGEVVLKLAAGTNAPAHNGVFRVTVCGEAGERSAVAELTASTEDNGVPGGFRELVVARTADLWLTVLPAPPATEPAKSAAAKP